MYKNINNTKIAVVIPSYRVTNHILGVISKIDKTVWRIYVVDDCCPDNSGEFVKKHCKDKRVRVLKNTRNLGVGGAVMRGYEEAIKDGTDVIVKIDGDGQMNPELLHRFVRPIIEGRADYSKGNRFYDLKSIKTMPTIRIFGNAVLSFMSKLSTGYWNIFDPTNGYTAIHANVAKRLPFEKISKRYFFETDMLFRLNTLRAKVVDIPMDAVYGEEQSNLKIRKIIFEFLFKHFRNFVKRIFYNYFLRDVSIASFELAFGVILLVFGFSFGLYHWLHSINFGIATPTGTIMVSVLPIVVGIQLLLNFISFDIMSQPNEAIHILMEDYN